MEPNQTRLVGDYILGSRIGRGSFAVVWRSIHRFSGLQVAVKEIDKKLLTPKVSENLLKEISILSTINHPNIIRFFESIEVTTLPLPLPLPLFFLLRSYVLAVIWFFFCNNIVFSRLRTGYFLYWNTVREVILLFIFNAMGKWLRLLQGTLWGNWVLCMINFVLSILLL